MVSNKLVIVIPTRNRFELARNAIKSVLMQKECEFEIIVSDNSTESLDVQKLEEFCFEQSDKRLRYIRPPEPLTMTKHWDWIMRQAIEIDEFSHITYLTDRMVFKPGSLADLVKLADIYPNQMISYSWDAIKDDALPVRLIQSAWTEKLFRIKPAHIFQMSSEMKFFIACLPKMLNTLVPRNVFEAINFRFGHYFLSNSPDFSFAFSALNSVESFIYYDKPLIIDYGLKVSNGYTISRGVLTKDSKQFIETADRHLSFETPLPEFYSTTSAVLDEYWKVKCQTSSKQMPEHDREKYIFALIKDILLLQNSSLKYKLLLRLYRASILKTFRDHLRALLDNKRAKYPLRTMAKRKLSKNIKFTTLEGAPEQTLFASADEAIAHASHFPREKSRTLDSICARVGLNEPEFGNMISVIDYELRS